MDKISSQCIDREVFYLDKNGVVCGQGRSKLLDGTRGCDKMIRYLKNSFSGKHCARFFETIISDYLSKITLEINNII